MFSLDTSKKSGQRLVGDVDFEGARHVASWITPVPGGGCLICLRLISSSIFGEKTRIFQYLLFTLN